MQSEVRTGTAAGAFARVCADRVVEVHVERLATVADVASLHVQVANAIVRAGKDGVICADHRLASPLSSEVADAWSRAMRRRKPRPARAAILLAPSNTVYNLQIERVLQCGGVPARLFVDHDEFLGWVGDALTESERRLVRDLFLEESPRPGARISHG